MLIGSSWARIVAFGRRAEAPCLRSLWTTRKKATPQEQWNVYQEAIRALGGVPPPRPADIFPPPIVKPPLSAKRLEALANSEVQDISKDDTLGPEELMFLADMLADRSLPSALEGAITIKADSAKAAAVCKLAGGRGSKEGMYRYAQYLLEGRKVAEARAILENLATAGYGHAQYSLAVFLLAEDAESRTSAAAASRAYDLLVCAVKAGVVPAIHNLANLLAEGRGPVKRHDDTAAKLYELGVEAGDAASAFTLATWYCAGRGVDEDWGKAYQLNIRAASGGRPAALFNLAMHYFTGRGVKQDFQQAAQLYRRAAEQGMVQAMVNLGNLLVSGRLGKLEVEEARAWYTRAAEKGSDAAKQCLQELADAQEKQHRVTEGKESPTTSGSQTKS